MNCFDFSLPKNQASTALILTWWSTYVSLPSIPAESPFQTVDINYEIEMLWVCRALVVLKKGSNQLKEAIRMRQDSWGKTRKMKKRSVVLLQRVEVSIRIEPYFGVWIFSAIWEESNVWLFEPKVSKETCGFFFTSVISIWSWKSNVQVPFCSCYIGESL